MHVLIKVANKLKIKESIITETLGPFFKKIKNNEAVSYKEMASAFLGAYRKQFPKSAVNAVGNFIEKAIEKNPPIRYK